MKNKVVKAKAHYNSLKEKTNAKGKKRKFNEISNGIKTNDESPTKKKRKTYSI